MRVVEGRVHVGAAPPGDVPAYDDVDAFVAALDEASDAETALQAFDARYVAGRDHLASAVEHANRSMARGENVADDRAVEILCYAAGRRQIQQALAMGVGEGTSPVTVVVDGPGEDRVADRVAALVDGDGGAAGDPETIADFFDIADAERGATDADLETLVRERVALLDVEK